MVSGISLHACMADFQRRWRIVRSVRRYKFDNLIVCSCRRISAGKNGYAVLFLYNSGGSEKIL